MTMQLSFALHAGAECVGLKQTRVGRTLGLRMECEHDTVSKRNAIAFSRRALVIRTAVALCLLPAKLPESIDYHELFSNCAKAHAIEKQIALQLKEMKDRRGRFELSYPSTWFKSERENGVVIGDFRAASILSVAILPAADTLKELLLARTSAGNKAAASAIAGGDRFIWQLARLSDVVTLVLAARDATAASSLSKQISTPTRAAIVPSSDYTLSSSPPSTTTNDSNILADTDAVDVRFETIIETQRPDSNTPQTLIQRTARTLVLYAPEADQLFFITLSAPSEVYSTGISGSVEHQIFSSFKLLPRR
mmetsp:Transcript_8677/g.18494  ORF Transcript_8677/g.18494 Transcript_8677/m.18494 type:complete len:308 (+) Transcript_8677:45-968(+)